ncbi:MAG: DUF2804 domain-containing protein [bacterium]
MDRRDFIRLCAGVAAFGAPWAAGMFDRAFAEQPSLDKSYTYYCPNLTEITEPGPIILPDGTCRCGWTRRPILDLNFEDAKFLPSKLEMKKAMKKWDMYHLYTPEYSMQFLIAWIPYAAFFNANIYIRKTNTFYEDTRFLPAKPEIPMMRNSSGGRSVFDSDQAKAVFEVDGDRHRLSVAFDGFSMVDKSSADLNLNGDKNLRTTFKVEADMLFPNDYDSISGSQLVNDRRCFYGHKINSMPTEGSVTFGGETSKMSGGSSFGALDFGRGFYPKKMFWHWATGSGRADDGKLIGFNLGYGNSPDNRTENAVFYDGKITKINAVDCVVPQDADLMNPWLVRDKEGLVDLTFKPLKVRYMDTKLGSGYSIGRPSLGLYSGKLATSSGKEIIIKDLFGLYEWVNSNW